MLPGTSAAVVGRRRWLWRVMTDIYVYRNLLLCTSDENDKRQSTALSRSKKGSIEVWLRSRGRFSHTGDMLLIEIICRTGGYPSSLHLGHEGLISTSTPRVSNLIPRRLVHHE